MPNGTLTEYVTKNPGANRIALLLDVAEGLKFLHASYTIHGGVKGPNILVHSNGHACLTGFALASVVRDGGDDRPRGYVVRRTAPEILRGAHEITPGADVFSFGMVVLEAFTGKFPLKELNGPSRMQKIMNGERPVHPSGTENLGLVAPVWNMTIDCWQDDPARRPTMAAVADFLRGCYALHAVDPTLSTLSPWNPTGKVGNIYRIISPTQSAGTQHKSGHSFTPVREQAQGPMFTIAIGKPPQPE